MLVLVVVLLATAVVAIAPWAVRRATSQFADRIGLEVERLDTVRLGLGEVELQRVALGPWPRVEIDRVTIDLGLGDLVRGRVGRIALHGMAIRLARSRGTREATAATRTRDSATSTPGPDDVATPLPFVSEARNWIERIARAQVEQVDLPSFALHQETASGTWVIAGAARLERANDGAIATAEGTVTPPDGEDPLRARAAAVFESAGRAAAGLSLASDRRGRAEAALATDLSDDTRPRTRGVVAARGLELDGVVRGLSLQGAVLADADPRGRARVVFTTPFRARWRSLDLARDVVPEGAGHLTVSALDPNRAPLTASARADGSLDLETALKVVVAPVHGDASDARFELDARFSALEGAIEAVEAASAQLRLRAWPIDTAAVDGRVELSLAGPSDALAGTIGVALQADAFTRDDLAARALEAEGVAQIALAPGRAALGLDRCFTLRAGELAVGDARLAPLAASLCESEPRVPVLAWTDGRRGEGAGEGEAGAETKGEAKGKADGETEARVTGERIAIRAALAPSALAGRLPPRGTLQGQSPRLQLAFDRTGPDDWMATLRGDGGSIAIGEDLAARELELRAVVAREAGALRGSGRAEVASVRHRAFVPTLVFIAEGTLRDDAGEAKLRLRDEDKRMVVDGVARHDLAKGRGNLVYELVDLEFEEAGLQPGDLLDALADVSAIGAISAGGTGRWTGEEPPVFTLDVGVDFPVWVTRGFPARGVAGSIRFDSLLPPSTPPDQRLTAEEIVAGLALRDVEFSFAVSSEDDATWFDFDTLRFDVAGGEVVGEGSVPLDLGFEADSSLQLVVRDVQLREVLAQLVVPGLSGHGQLDGIVPVEVEAGNFRLDGGELSARRPGGVIRYLPRTRPAALGQAEGSEAVGTLLDALANFHYDEMRVTTQGGMTGDFVLGVYLAGRNPDLYEGIPFELNVPITFSLGSLLRSMAAIYMSERSLEELSTGGGSWQP